MLNAFKSVGKKIGRDILSRFYDRIIDWVVHRAINGKRPKQDVLDNTRTGNTIDAYRIAEDMYGPEMMEKRQRGAASINAYVKNVLGKVAEQFIGGGGSFKKFLFQAIDLTPLFVTKEYEDSYEKLKKKYRRASTKEEARLIKNEMRRIRQEMLWVQPVTFAPQSVIEREGKFFAQSVIEVHLTRDYIKPVFSRSNDDGEIRFQLTHLKFMGSTFSKKVFIPPIDVRTRAGTKKSLRDMIRKKIVTHRFEMGFDIVVSFLVEEKEVSPENIDNPEEKVEPEMVLA